MTQLTRIQQLFANDKAFIAYLTAGDGGTQNTLDAAFALIDAGVNMLEIGMPFSDPIADGPVIQRASARALEAGTSLQDILWIIKEIRKKSDIPLILFSYLNPLMSALSTHFFAEAKKCGLDGLLLVDCPLEESSSIQQVCDLNHLDLIYVITPSTPLERVKKINDHAHGFLYYACRKGITGEKNALPTDFEENIQLIKSVINLPIVVGFGISNATMVQQVLTHADGVVIGSLFVKALEDGYSPADLCLLAKNLMQS